MTWYHLRGFGYKRVSLDRVSVSWRPAAMREDARGAYGMRGIR